MGRAGRGRVSLITRWQVAAARAAGTCGPAGSHSLARHAVAEHPGITHRAARAGPRGLRLVRRGAAGRQARAGHGLGARHALLRTRHARAAGHGLPGHRLPRQGLPGHRLACHGLPRQGLPGHRLAVSRRLPLAQVIAGRSGHAARTVGCPAWTRRVHPGLVAGARRRGSGPARWRPVLAPATVRTSRARASRTGTVGTRASRTRVDRAGTSENLASENLAAWDGTVRGGAGGAQDFRDGRTAWRAWSRTVPGHVDQATRGVHVGGVHRPTSGTAGAVPGGPGVPRRLRGLRAGRFLAVSGHSRLRLRPTGSSEPADGEKHQDHQAERDSGRDHVQADPGQVGRRDRRVLADVPQDDTCRHEEGADHHRRGSRNCQEEDETHPPGSGGMGAHWSTIASRLPARKPNG
jgi:hypothetical protein